MKINSRGMRDTIIRLVKENPELADDDKRLIATVWWYEGWQDPNLYEYLKSVSSSETIRRTRQKLVEEGVIKPSDEVQEHRYQEFKEARMSI